jgi:predicted dehydrogenase
MVEKLRWGVLGTARIAVEKVIPALQRSEFCETVAVASRQLDRAKTAASTLGVSKAYGSYEALLADPDIDAIYNPLPNHLHVPWSIRAAEAGKHVLCEKPVALTAVEAEQLLAARDRTGVRIQEAFMVRTHPQWTGAIDLIRQGRIGEVRSVVGAFSFFMDDAPNIRTVAEYGGGGLMDLGCYLVHAARWVFGREPERVIAAMERDEHSGIDRLASIMLAFGASRALSLPGGYAVGTCSMFQGPYQRVHILGTQGRVEIEIPFNAPLDRPCRIFVGDGSDPTGVEARTVEFDTCNQYTIEVDGFARAILDGTDVPLPLEDSVKNMRVLDALVRSAESGRWEEPERNAKL